MESQIDRLVSLIFATNRLLHEQKDQGEGKTCSYLHLVTLAYIKKKKPLMKDIAGLLGIAPPSATSLVGTLAKTKLVKRQTDVSDRRIVRIEITKKGEGYLETYKQKAAERLQQNLKRLTLGEQKQLASSLKKITETEE